MKCPHCESKKFYVSDVRGSASKTEEGQVEQFLRVLCRCSECEKQSAFEFRVNIDIEPLIFGLIHEFDLSSDK